MKIIYYCQNNPPSFKAFETIISKGFAIDTLVVSDSIISDYFINKCNELNIKCYCASTFNLLDNYIYDLLISFSYHKLISKREIDNAKMAINFHPAPLPQYRGLGTNMWGIINNETEWGATCHYLDEHYDTGKIIECRKFKIDKNIIKTGIDLSNASWDACIELLSDVLDEIRAGKIPTGISQKKEEGKTYTKKDLESIKNIDTNEDPELIIRKIHALWYPPYKGAYTLINNQKVYLLTEDLLLELFEKLNKK